MILASTSPYRRELLARLRLAFESVSPGVDEIAADGEDGAATASRLSQAKARAVAPQFQDALIVGSDQVAESEGLRLEKPGCLDRAVEQLRWLSGKAAVFNTAVTLLNAASGREQTEVVATLVRFRRISEREIQQYLLKEPAYDCAGSAKSEGLGISLLESIEGTDPTALVGLPLIALCGMLRSEGMAIP